jgi:hypothetical protein
LKSVYIRPEATQDVARAAGWHESRRVNLGVEFVLEVDSAIDRTAEAPQHYAPLHGQIRHVPLRRFPYNVCFI